MRNIKNQLVGLDSRFEYRGLNQTRIETFSDAVFAVAFTLVVLSSTVPETFDELRKSIEDIIPSFICIVLIVVIWYQHYVFFIRYGLQNTKTVTVNTLLLFTLLIYVYPLKFLARFLVELYGGLIFGKPDNFMNDFGGEMNGENMTLLMTAYGAGATLIFMTMAWLYRHAYKKRDELELDDYESFATKVSLWQNVLMSAIPFLSTITAFFHPFGQGALNFAVAGFIYMLYPPVMITFGYRVRKKSKQLFG
ncbi:MAG: TMEM175 family protein [Ekhidna sp.]|uniref:TMEM175 family protein n=1 Tax=Ekhidna sp. TaxID=2608089 RepID=UPI0032ECDA66